MIIGVYKYFFYYVINGFFSFFMLFWLDFFLFLVNFFLFLVGNFVIINNWFYVFYLFSWLLKITLLVMLLNSKNSNILYFLLFGIGSRFVILFLFFTLFWLLGYNLLLLDWWLLRFLILIIYHFIHFVFVVLIVILSLVSFVTIRQWRVVKIPHAVVELALHLLLIELVILVY